MDRKFAEIAVKEARKCVSEPGKVSPMVGAVAVLNGKILGQAYRGEYAEGEHAEFTLLERKLKDVPLAGATIYTTLEPCTHRNPPKIECVARLIERKVSRVVIGTLDCNEVVCGKGENRLREANIIVDKFPSELVAELEELNRDFIRDQKKKLKGPFDTRNNYNEKIEGLWLCQYMYSGTNEFTGEVKDDVETQIVKFEQKGSKIIGATIFAQAHPEYFEGEVDSRYFTGLYKNSNKEHFYHGAFQFILSNSKNRMLGKWIGFNREGTDVDTGDWRWQKIPANIDTEEKLKMYWDVQHSSINLLSLKRFL